MILYWNETKVDLALSSLPKEGRAFALKSDADLFLPRKILLIEDDREFAYALAKAIEDSTGSEVTIAFDERETAILIMTRPFDLIVADWSLTTMNAFSTIEKICERIERKEFTYSSWFELKAPVIILSGCDKSLVDNEVEPLGPFRYIGFVTKQKSLADIIKDLSRIYVENAIPTLLSRLRLDFN